MNHKRRNYLEWEEYFMSIAFLSAQRSKDPLIQIGACIVNRKNKVVGIGYNGMPVGCSDDAMPWNNFNKAGDRSQEQWLQSKLPYVCHAELNAVLNKNCADLKDCIIYVALFPCNMCAQIIIQSGISEVVYFTDEHPQKCQTMAAKHLLNMAGITCRQFIPKQSRVIIDFGLIEETPAPEPTLPTCCLASGEADLASVCSHDKNANCNDKTKDAIDAVELESFTTKRSNYLTWEEYFMSMAFLSAQRSKDPKTQVGACIVNSEKKIMGIGYNGMPIGCNDDAMPWNRAADGTDANWLNSKSPYVCHAELNAVLNKNSADIKGCIIYVALFPCNTCAQVCIQAGITEVVYYSDKYHSRPEFKASRHMLKTAGVKYWQFRPRQEQIVITFKETTELLERIDCEGKDMEVQQETICSRNPKVQSIPDRAIISNARTVGLSENIQDINEHEKNARFGWPWQIQEMCSYIFSFLTAGFMVGLSWYASEYGLVNPNIL